MQFSSQLFGQVTKTCLAKVTNHAYRSDSTDVSDSLVSSLLLFKTFLLAQKLRLVSPSLSQTWTVFTDASCEQEEAERPVAGFGGVLMSLSGGGSPPISSLLSFWERS